MRRMIEKDSVKLDRTKKLIDDQKGEDRIGQNREREQEWIR